MSDAAPPAPALELRPTPFDASDGVIRIDDRGRHRITWERHLPHPPERLWRAIADQDEVARWARASWAFEPRIGGAVHLCVDIEPPSEKRILDPGRVTACDPPRVLEFTIDVYRYNGPDSGEHVLRWELEPAGRGCMLRFSDTFALGHRVRSTIACGWHCMLDQLDAHLATDGAQPGTTDEQMARVYWRYRNARRPAGWPG